MDLWSLQKQLADEPSRASVRSLRLQIADRLCQGPPGTCGDDHHLAAVGLLQPEGLLDRHLVHRIQDRLDRVAVQREVGRVEDLVGGCVGDTLDADSDVQWHCGRILLHFGR